MKTKNNFSHTPIRFYSNDDKYNDQINLWNDFAKYHREKISKQNIKNDNFMDYNAFQSNDVLTHIDSQTNKPKQVDISEKLQPNETKKTRIACASGYIQLNETTFNAIVKNELRKGNALIVAQLAGISASKQTSHLIPLCHQILLDVCDVDFKCDSLTNRIHCEVVCKTSISKTGVEMEALTACSIALLTIYDMCKAIQKDAVINDIKLEYKYGGKSDFVLDEH
jgi:cyclic pyranopterin phosphate synthase